MADTGKTRVKRETDREASYRIPDCAPTAVAAQAVFASGCQRRDALKHTARGYSSPGLFSTGSSSPLRAVAQVFESLMAREHARFVTVVENKSLVSGVGVSSKTTDYSHKIIRLEACPADKRSVDIRLLGQSGRVVGFDAAAVHNANHICHGR